LVCLSSNMVLCVAFKPDNPNILVSGSYDKTIKMWDITSGSCVSTLGCSSEVLTIALKDNMTVAGCYDGTIKLFKLNESQDWGEIQSEPPLTLGCAVYTSAVVGVAFSADGQWLIAGSEDGMLRLLDAHPKGGTVVSAV